MEKVHVSYWKKVAHSISLCRDSQGESKPYADYYDEPLGWSCWVYANFDFEDWMETNMTGEYECIPRFNSGDPMFTVWIKEERDAQFFALNFL